MKTIITTIAIAALTLLGAAPQAEARSHHSSRIYISGYRSCGTPVYTERYFIGYDHCGNPLWGTRVIRRHYRPVVRPYHPSPHRTPARYGVVIQGRVRL
jgi:hypothetical protein